jgi:hypothetical protein
MKEYNEYEDKLVSFDTAVKADQAGYENLFNGYDVECFTCSDDTKRIADSWSGLIAEGEHFMVHRPTITGLQKWLRNEHNIHVFIGFRPNVKKWDSHAYDMKLNGREYVLGHPLSKYITQGVYDDYESALEFGVVEGLELIISNIKE